MTDLWHLVIDPIRRPLFDVGKRLVWWFLCGAIMLSGYAVAKLEPWSTPILLPLTEFDRAIPFVPATVWVYGSLSITSLWCWLQVPDRLSGRRLFFSTILAASICWVFFAFFPTTFPRELYPLTDLSTASLREMADLRGADSPTNCFPSQHVALVWAMTLTWACFIERLWARPLPVLYAVCVSLCTLTTKQHYIVDVVAGMVVGVGAWWVMQQVQEHTPPYWSRFTDGLRFTRETDRNAIAALRRRVENHQWDLDDIEWPTGPLQALDPVMIRLLNQVIYIEEIAGLNFQLISQAADDENLRMVYHLFAVEERRHADGLRRILALHDAPLQTPGLGNALVLDQFDDLTPQSDADVALVAISTPVFETFLDAGTIPFLRAHPALKCPAMDALVKRIDADEGLHLAAGWMVAREVARQHPGRHGLRMLLNPAVLRGMSAVPWMSLDVYSLAYRLGFDFRSLLGGFGKVWRTHRRFPEFEAYLPWMAFRLFVVCGVIATMTCLAMHRTGLLWGRLWTMVTACTDLTARTVFGPNLLIRRALPQMRSHRTSTMANIDT